MKEKNKGEKSFGKANCILIVFSLGKQRTTLNTRGRLLFPIENALNIRY